MVSKEINVKHLLFYPAMLLFLGIVLGIGIKYLGNCDLINILDIGNFLVSLPFWMFTCMLISIKTKSAKRASINVLSYCLGISLGYCLTSQFYFGFLPGTYMEIIRLVLVSPVLAYICWYSKLAGKIALGISSVIIASLFNFTFVYGDNYFDVVSILDMLLFFLSIAVLKRSWEERAIILGGGILLAIFFHILNNYLGFGIFISNYFGIFLIYLNK